MTSTEVLKSGDSLRGDIECCLCYKIATSLYEGIADAVAGNTIVYKFHVLYSFLPTYMNEEISLIFRIRMTAYIILE